MQYRQLGQTDLRVSLIGLGTMTWGEQNTEAEAHAQLDFAIERGITLIDTAEMYPVPPKAETYGLTERYIGTWLKKRGRRDDVIIASKIAGPQRQPHQPQHIRGASNQFDRPNLEAALHASLDRLQTDYLDIYQLHWPDRSTNTFGRLGYPWIENEQSVAIEETLSVLAEFVKTGKVRHIGISNETPWGVMQFLRASEKLDLPRIVSIQNPYSLLNRTFEIGLAEFTHREKIDLLAYSPMAFGMLSGKYLDGARPQGARLTLYSRFQRYNKPSAETATHAYAHLARQHGLSPAQMALAFVNSRPFVASNLIGATTLKQLEENIASVDLTLSADVIASIEAIHANNANPAP
ncbi:NADP(H)-dependent aldo-keto reductase [Chitinimonas sp. PSY-7]|uniref:NADP(H)-dependent aldo-keto reductase n=1 Tax=Chitinimonas sp. PSY-7 TaxID=3459088 RepID=UPI004040140D